MITRVLILAGLVFAVSAPTSAQVFVGQNSEAHSCYLRTKSDLAGRDSSIEACEDAVSSGSLNKKDQAATLVNLGILRMRAGHYDQALGAYDAAITLKPKLAEAYINRGACLIHLARYEDAVAALTNSLELKTDHRPDALYNRGMAYDRLERARDAYMDFKEAAALRPDWELPARALERYQVVSKPKG